MCVAALIETDKGPEREELRSMHQDNPHGAGVAFADGDTIRYHKGVTWEWIARNQHKFPRPYLLHFRWATHGGRARHLAHPFPISISALLSRKLQGTADAVLIHNGVWTDYMDFLPHWATPEVDQISDTAVAAYAAKVYGESVLDDVAWSTAVGRAARRGRMDVTLRGRWLEHNGNQYSNLLWLPRKYNVSPGPSCGLPAGYSYVKDTDGVYRLERENEPWQAPSTMAGWQQKWDWDDDGKLIARHTPSNDEEPTPLNPDAPLWLASDPSLTEDDALAQELKDQRSTISQWLDEYHHHVEPKKTEG